MSSGGPTTFDPLAVARPTLVTPLARILADRIQQSGPITFRDWMQACLYHPQHGYYRRGQPTVGRDGDFLTSPEVHPLFGAAIGHVAAELWKQLGRPAPLRIAEIGPGTGALAESLLRHLHATKPELATSVQYTLIEPDAKSASAQRQRLDSLAEINASPDLADLDADQHLIVANELLDALPVHLLRFETGAWRELYVDYSPGGGFHTVTAEPSSDSLLDPLRAVGQTERQVVEVGPERSRIVEALAGSLADRGVLLLFDYGYRRERLYASWRRDGTLMTFRRHVPGDDPLAHPGEQDITAHVDIDQIWEASRAAGLTPLPTLSQAEWLHNLGAAVLPAVAEAGSDTGAYLAARRAAETLTDPGGLGRIAVMGFSNGSILGLPGWETT